MNEQLEKFYGNRFSPDLLEKIDAIGTYKKVNEGDTLIEIGDYIKHIPLLLTGAIKIIREDHDGGELLLYFLERGDTCAMTLSCCMGQSLSQIRATAEVNTELILIPVEKMEEWLNYKGWRDFIFESYNGRLYEMLDAIDSLAFTNLNERLLKYLHNKSAIKNSNSLSLSHQEIAFELNTSRVVISRLLKQLENEGKVKLLRNKLEII